MLKEKYIRYIGIALIAFGHPFVFPDIGEGIYWEQVMIAGIHAFVYWQGNVSIILYLRKKFPSYQENSKRLTYLIICCTVYTVVVGSILNLFLVLWRDEVLVLAPKNWGHLLKDFVINFIVSMTYETSYFLQKWRETFIEAEQLKHQALRSRYETLKNQVSPHFLFNSLNTLITLIPEDPQLAVRFTEQLSKVYRYILQNKNKELVSLHTELEFTQAYIFLQKNRFGENLKVDFRIPEEHLEAWIAPLTLQMLVENAIKHNEVSKARPLFIDVYIAKNDLLVVKNNLQKKKIAVPSTQIGLENIRKRYQYLSKQTVDVIATAHNFIVTLPLIHVYESAHH